MEKLKPITIENNEQYLRQISKKVNIEDPELHNNLVVLQDYCMQNEVMAMAAVQLGIPKRIVYVKNTNLDILNKRLTDEGKEETKDYNEAKVLEVYNKLNLINIPFSNNIIKRASELRQYNIKNMDSLHIAYAESSNIDYFITTDKLLINASSRANLNVKVINPISFIMEVI